MQILDLKPKPLNKYDWANRSAKISDCTQFVQGEFTVVVDGEIKIACVVPDFDYKELSMALNSVEFVTSPRTNGMLSTSRVFGFQPRNVLRRDFCGASILLSQNRSAHQVIAAHGKLVASEYVKLNANLFAEHNAITSERILKQYRLPETPFTSGIVNQNNPLKYHYDSGNFKNVWSGMIVLKTGVAGGHLNMPEFDLMAELPNGSILFFDGQGIMHGVTPIEKLYAGATRYSVVFYSMLGMWKCEPVNDEISRFRRLRTERQNKRVSL